MNKITIKDIIVSLVQASKGFEIKNVDVETEENFVIIKYNLINLCEMETEKRSILVSKHSTFNKEDEQVLGIKVERLIKISEILNETF